MGTIVQPNYEQVLETLECATEENKLASERTGQVVNLPAQGEIWITGDIHDHRRNFEKFVAARSYTASEYGSVPRGRSISARETWRKLSGLPSACARASSVVTTS